MASKTSTHTFLLPSTKNFAWDIAELYPELDPHAQSRETSRPERKISLAMFTFEVLIFHSDKKFVQNGRPEA